MITKLLNFLPLHTGNRGIDRERLVQLAEQDWPSLKPQKATLSAVFRVKNAQDTLWLSYLSIAPLCSQVIIIDNESTDATAVIIARIKIHCEQRGVAFVTQSYNKPIATFGRSYQAQLAEDKSQSIADYYNFAFSHVTSNYAIKVDAGCIFYPKALKAMRRAIDSNRPLVRMRGMEYFGKTMAYEPRLFSMDAYGGFVDGPYYEVIKLKDRHQKYNPRNFYLPPAYLHFSRLILSETWQK